MRFKPDDDERIMDLLVGAGLKSGGGSVEEKKSLDAIAILSLPPHLRETAVAIHRLGTAKASEIAEITARDVKVESDGLEELADMGYLTRERLGDQAYYKIN